jgi:hypothetical protein
MDPMPAILNIIVRKDEDQYRAEANGVGCAATTLADAVTGLLIHPTIMSLSPPAEAEPLDHTSLDAAIVKHQATLNSLARQHAGAETSFREFTSRLGTTKAKLAAVTRELDEAKGKLATATPQSRYLDRHSNLPYP